MFDQEEAEQTGVLQVKHALPYSDLTSLSQEQRDKLTQEGLAFVFGHTLQQQMGGQLAAGFILTDLYEDDWDNKTTPLNRYTPVHLATLARKIRVE